MSMKCKKKRSPRTFYRIIYAVLSILIVVASLNYINYIASTKRFVPCFHQRFANRINSIPLKLDILRRLDGHFVIYALDSSGERICRLNKVYFDSDDIDVVLSPDDTKIVFTISDDHRLIVVNVDGSDVVDLSEVMIEPPRINRFFNPVWSPDGERIVVQHGSYSEYISIINPDGSNWAEFKLEGTAWYPADWSADSQWVTFAMYTGPGKFEAMGIYIMDRNGNELIRLTEATVDSLHGEPQWINDEEITFLSGWEYNSRREDNDFQERCTVIVATKQVECEPLE